MILTITLNPSVDRTIVVDELRRGAVHRATSGRVDPGGKGINVARALSAHGIKTTAVVALGGAEGHHLAAMLEVAGIEVVGVPISGSTRSNVTVVEPDGTTTKLNEPGAALTEAETSAVLGVVAGQAAGAEWVVLSGRLPPGADVDLYARIVHLADRAGALAVLDTSGPALAAGIAAGPALVKPNAEELEELVGRPLETVGDVVKACRDVLDAGAGQVLASLGADGAILVGPEGVLHARGPHVHPLSSVGAGDALLAGFLAGGGRGREALAAAVAWGTAAVSLPGSRMPGPADVHPELVVLDPDPDPARRLPAGG
ncbi:1-phosphofructokinase [Kineosporia sp. A_224]|uniref:1-phosphofructokinase n=1 Tax=Kineosporia sp. A_224 TaxID=1962180 RepID=UPI000B4B239D|nr:1-phosphofructokinase [Kineosporia sp. A_224]